MPTQNIHVLQEVGSLEKLYDEVAKLQKALRYLLDGQIDFENIRARSIKAENIEVGSLTAEEIKAGTITADKMDVDELSAIAANLGTITAGIIYGAYIATANGTYPRTEMSAASNLFGAYSAAGEGVEVVPSGFDGRAALSFVNGGTESGFITSTGIDLLIKANSRLRLDANEDVLMISGGLRGFVFQNFGYIYGSDEGETLQKALNDLSDRITALGG